MDALAAIKRLGGGHFLEQVADQLGAVAEEVVRTRQKGSVTIKLEVVALNQGGELAVAINETITRKVPSRKPLGAIFYAHDGGLYRDDPRQARMQFKAVPDSEGTVREVADAPAIVREG